MAVLIIFPVFVQTAINLTMLSIGGQRETAQTHYNLVELKPTF